MKANELMTGDLIYVYGRNNNVFSEPHWYIRKVTADWLAAMERREANDKKLTDNGIVIQNQLFIGDTKPIPLTEEILKANGFGKNFSERYTKGIVPFEVNLRGKLKYITLGGQYLCNCDYVHELQHALRLPGLNELADNLKI